LTPISTPLAAPLAQHIYVAWTMRSGCRGGCCRHGWRTRAALAWCTADDIWPQQRARARRFPHRPRRLEQPRGGSGSMARDAVRLGHPPGWQPQPPIRHLWRFGVKRAVRPSTQNSTSTRHCGHCARPCRSNRVTHALSTCSAHMQIDHATIPEPHLEPHIPLQCTPMRNTFSL
jgi:hypothetical protein